MKMIRKKDKESEWACRWVKEIEKEKDKDKKQVVSIKSH
jgi:hypothetical protein